MTYDTDLFGKKKLTEGEEIIINEALYYAVRENFNQKIDKSKTEKLRKALDIMKEKGEIPVTQYMVHIALEDFFTSCVRRGWENELEKLAGLEVGHERN